MKHSNPTSSARGNQYGRTMVELMISLVLGLVVLGAVMNTVASNGAGGRTANGVSKLNEDAQVALNLVSSHLRMGGFSLPRINGIPGLRATNYNGMPIRGCDSRFANPTTPNQEVLACAGFNQPNAVAVAYEADQFNSLTLVPGQPTDCLGQALAAQASPFAGNFFLAQNRFWIRTNAGQPELVCAGGGDNFATPQVMMRNVEDMRLTYGVGDMVTGPFGNTILEGRVRDYLTAAQLDAHPVYGLEPAADRWRRVSSVRVCLQLRSDDNMADAPTPYVDCFGAVITPADRRLRVAVTTTINLRNTTDAGLGT
ncbi:MAG: PilW family protein [Burkholderiaceae bacterium]